MRGGDGLLAHGGEFLVGQIGEQEGFGILQLIGTDENVGAVGIISHNNAVDGTCAAVCPVIGDAHAVEQGTDSDQLLVAVDGGEQGGGFGIVRDGAVKAEELFEDGHGAPPWVGG